VLFALDDGLHLLGLAGVLEHDTDNMQLYVRNISDTSLPILSENFSNG